MFSILSERKNALAKLLRTAKVRFLCRTRRKAQEYWLCIPSIFNEVRREKILFAAIASLSCTPFLLGFVDFFTAGLFFLLYMPFGGLQAELDEILGRRTRRYAAAYLLGIPTLFVYTLVWMARIAEELKARAIELGVEGLTPRSGTCLTGTSSASCASAP